MLSLKQCRQQHLPAKLRSMSDEELERLRDALAGLASVVLDSFDQIRTTDSSQSAHLSGDPSRPGQSSRCLTTWLRPSPNLTAN